MWKWKKMSKALGPMMVPKDPEGDGEGGGGGAAAFTAEQLKEMTKVVNSAVTGQLGRKLKEAVSSEMSTALAPVLERLEALGKKPDDEGGGGEGGGANSKTKGLPPEVAKRLDELERTNKKLVADNQRATEQSEAQRKATEASEERTELQAALKRAGVSDDRVAGAAALIYHDQRKVKRNANGEIRFTQKDNYGNVEEVDLDTGLAEWVKTEGKAYLPPVNVQGGGSRGGNAGNNRGKAEPTESELLGELGNVLMGGKPTINLGG